MYRTVRLMDVHTYPIVWPNGRPPPRPSESSANPLGQGGPAVWLDEGIG